MAASSPGGARLIIFGKRVAAEGAALFAGIITAGESDVMFCEEITLALEETKVDEETTAAGFAVTIVDEETTAAGFEVTVAGLETTVAGRDEVAIGDDRTLAGRDADR